MTGRPQAFTPLALGDVEAARTWYDTQRPGLGADFTDALEGALSGIDRMPLMHPKLFGPYRSATLTPFPYKLIYKVEADTVTIVAVYHSHRDPDGWRDRV